MAKIVISKLYKRMTGKLLAQLRTLDLAEAEKEIAAWPTLDDGIKYERRQNSGIWFFPSTTRRNAKWVWFLWDCKDLADFNLYLSPRFFRGHPEELKKFIALLRLVIDGPQKSHMIVVHQMSFWLDKDFRLTWEDAYRNLSEASV